jgi:hypothetical protein
MIFTEEFDQSLINSIDDNFLLDEKRALFPFSIDESELQMINNDKSSIPKNIFITKKTIKEKIKHQKSLLEQKRGHIEKEKKEIYFDKKEDLKRRNREAAQKSRDKKKLEFRQIIEENKKLKDEIYIINSKINLLCSGCKSIFDLNTSHAENNKQDKDNDNLCVNCTSTNNNLEDINDNILNSHSNSSLTIFGNLRIQKLFNLAFISLLGIFCIFEVIINIPINTNNDNNKIYEQLRNIEEIEQNGTLKIDNRNINKIKDNPLGISNISTINDYIFKKNNYIDTNVKINVIDKVNEDKNNNINHYKNEFCEKDFFTSFQCKKKLYDNNDDYIGDNNIDDKNYFKDNKDKNVFSISNNNKNSIYFKLIVQSCSKDEMDSNQNNSFNDNTHYILSNDDNMCHDFYYFCQRTEN